MAFYSGQVGACFSYVGRAAGALFYLDSFCSFDVEEISKGVSVLKETFLMI
jgi:hypothetical protein